MPNDSDTKMRGDHSPPSLGWLTVVGALVFYAAMILVATYPAVRTCQTRLAAADLTDPLQHLWCLRWYRTCLEEGASPLFCPEIQYPEGSPLGLYSPLQLQSLVYLGCSYLTKNDALLFNAILFAEYLFTGIGTFLLAWFLTRERWGSILAGLLAMLGGPMMFGAWSGGTELLALGGFPLFLVGWLRFVDRPSLGRLAAAIGLFLLLAACSPYYGVLGVFPAVLYVMMQAVGGGRRGVGGWLKPRIGWFLAFSLLVILTIPLLFPAQIWAVVHGYSMERSRIHFEQFGTSVWNYLIPPPENCLMYLVLPPFWKTPGVGNRPTVYLGMVTLGLLGYAVARGVRFRQSRFLWFSFAMFVVLSLGAYGSIGDYKVSLPADWLWDWFPPFRSLRVPARFGYFGAICAAVLAGGALRPLLERIRCRGIRAVIIVGLVVLAVADLARVPFITRELPALPDCYAFLLRNQPGASFCEIHPAENHLSYESTITYWQALHGGRTSAGNPGVNNRPLMNHVLAASPFSYKQLSDLSYLSEPGPETIDLIQGVDFEDYAWLFLTVHGFDDLILHKWTWGNRPMPAPLLRIRERLAEAIVFEDEATVAFDRARLEPPQRPTLICTEGWRERFLRRGRYSAIATEDARLMLFNPTPERALRLKLTASAFIKPRTVRLLADGRELACWRVQPTESADFVSPPFRLPEGLHELSLASDGASPPAHPKSAPTGGPLKPFSLWVSGLQIIDPGKVPTP